MDDDLYHSILWLYILFTQENCENLTFSEQWTSGLDFDTSCGQVREKEHFVEINHYEIIQTN